MGMGLLSPFALKIRHKFVLKSDIMSVYSAQTLFVNHSAFNADFWSRLIQEAQLMLANLRDVFIGQSRSPNIVPFHMLGIVILPLRGIQLQKMSWPWDPGQRSLKVIESRRSKKQHFFTRFRVPLDCPAHNLQDTVLPQTNGTDGKPGLRVCAVC